jgi:hypothetical protein
MLPRRLLLIAIAAALPASALEIDRVYGEAGFKFLKLPLSPRVVGLAGAGAALVDGAGELDLNPAAPADDSASLVVGKGFPYGEFEAGSSHITWSVPFRGYRILVNARYLGFDKINGYDDLGKATAPYGAHTLKGQAGVAGKLQALSWGVTVNYAENSIASANYGSAMINAGARYAVLPGLHAGLSLINADFWGSKAQDASNPDPFPPTALQAGLSYARPVGAGVTAAVAVDARTRNDEELAFPAGLEASWHNMVFLRAGLPFGEQTFELGEAFSSLHAGLGLRWSIFDFQYAFEAHPELSPAHFWELAIHY